MSVIGCCHPIVVDTVCFIIGVMLNWQDMVSSVLDRIGQNPSVTECPDVIMIWWLESISNDSISNLSGCFASWILVFVGGSRGVW